MSNSRSFNKLWLILRKLVLSNNWQWVHRIVSSYLILNPFLDEGRCSSSSPYPWGRRDHAEKGQVDSARLVTNSYSFQIFTDCIFLRLQGEVWRPQPHVIYSLPIEIQRLHMEFLTIIFLSLWPVRHHKWWKKNWVLTIQTTLSPAV